MAWLSATAAGLAAVPAWPAPASETTLTSHAVWHREITGARVHRFRVALLRDEYVGLTVEQLGIDLELEARGPSGERVALVDVLDAPRGAERLSLLAEADGTYRLAIRAVQRGAPAGAYRLTVDGPRHASPADRATNEAQQALQAAMRLWNEGSAESSAQALASVRRAQAQAELAGDLVTQARALRTQGVLERERGQPTQALECYERARELAQAAGDRRGEAIGLVNTGALFDATGQPRQAAEAFEQALAIFDEIGESGGEGPSLARQNLASVHASLGSYQKALDLLRQALAAARASGAPRAEASALANLAGLFGQLGEERTALLHLREARALFRAQHEPRYEARSLIEVGRIRRRLGESQARAAFRDAVTLCVKAGDPEGEALARIELGALHASTGATRLAAEQLGRALLLARRVGSPVLEARALCGLAELRLAKADAEEAGRLLDQARALASRAADSPTALEVQRLSARLLALRGDLDGAVAASASALALAESVREGIVSPDFRTGYRASVRDLYERQVDLLVRMHERNSAAGHDARALEALEGGRARTLAELITEGRLEPSRDVDPALRQRERELAARLAWLKGRSSDDPESAAALELETLARERRELEEQVKRSNPRYAEVRYPPRLALADIQSLLTPDAALLEYSLGESAHLFVVTREGLECHRLAASPAAIELEVMRLRAALRAGSQWRQGAYLQAARRLYEQLVAPAAATLTARRKLLIVPDGALAYLPFEALLTESPTSGRRAYLLRRWSVAYVPSAGVLASLRARRLERGDSAGKPLVAFADPPTVGHPAPVGRSASTANPPSRERLRQVLDDLGWRSLPPLPDARREALGLASLFGPGEVGLYLGAAASEDALKTAPEVANARRLHLATHALVSPAHPEQSALVLARDAASREDGLLQAFEVYDLALRAELVVLSACETALGRELEGEGVVGLARAFLHAGAARIVASLWRVADRSTADLMLAFYRQLGRELDPSEALRRAKLTLAEGGPYAHPYHWAGFVLVGEP